MRVIECNECGATVSAANDEELQQALNDHMSSEHEDVEWDSDQAGELIERDAYDAMDS